MAGLPRIHPGNYPKYLGFPEEKKPFKLTPSKHYQEWENGGQQLTIALISTSKIIISLRIFQRNQTRELDLE